MLNQMTLAVRLRDDATFTNFYPGANQQVLSYLKQTIQGQGERAIFLWGKEGVGRSHLLQACCHYAEEQGLSALYLSLQSVQSVAPAMLMGLESYALICIDDIDGIAGQPNWEEALFHFYNRLHERGSRLVVSATHPPLEISLSLRDLTSRLAWGMVFQLHALTDEDKIAALQLRAAQRGLRLQQSVARFLLQRCPRSMAQLFAALERLDEASLTAQRHLTIPFVKQILGL
ncbi:DnaA regulatory inactivator Hda [soil metagenome]